MSSPAEQLAATTKRKRRAGSAAHGPLICNARSLRQTLDLTLADVAKATGICQACVSVVERGNDVTMSTALKLALFYGVPLSEIWPTPEQSQSKVQAARKGEGGRIENE